MSTPFPSGMDRADGLGGRYGTITPTTAIKVQSSQGVDVVPFEELPDSPIIERAEQATFQKDLRMSWDDALTWINIIGRGCIQTDSNGIKTRVLSAKIQHQPGGLGKMSVTSESADFDSPPDEFEVVPVELGINILKHPRYFYALRGDGPGTETGLRNQAIIRKLQDYFENPSAALRDAYTTLIYDSIGHEDGVPYPDSTDGPNFPIAGTDLAKRAALEIIQKYWNGEETPYVVGYQITWSRYYFRLPYLHPGGVIQNPITESDPQLPDYFWSPDDPPTSATIFDKLKDYNPQCYSSNGTTSGTTQISWLRKADQYRYQRMWYKVDRIWIGSPVGFWDPELYTASNRPLVVSDYLPIRPDANP